MLSQFPRVLLPPTRRGERAARFQYISGRLEHASSVSAGSDREPSSRGWWYAVPPNMWLQLTVQLVTPLTGARGAPSCPAAEPGC